MRRERGSYKRQFLILKFDKSLNTPDDLLQKHSISLKLFSPTQFPFYLFFYSEISI